MKIYKGTSVSQGIAVGNAFIVNHNEKPTIPKIKITQEEKIHSWTRFETALSDVTEYYKTLKEGSNKEQSDIIDTYLMMLSDTTFISQIKEEFLLLLVCETRWYIISNNIICIISIPRCTT